MLDILIVEGDPVISLDIADTALTLDPGARIRVFDDPAKVRCERFTHAFLRAGPDVVPLALRLAEGEARVFLLGAERLPDALDDAARVAVVPFPFTAEQMTALLGGGVEPGSPPAS